MEQGSRETVGLDQIRVKWKSLVAGLLELGLPEKSGCRPFGFSTFLSYLSALKISLTKQLPSLASSIAR
jgi:hypothetical protein